MKKSKILSILKSQRGASLVLVLCVMLLLMGISGSALFAASSASGGSTSRQAYDRQLIYNDALVGLVTFSVCRLNAEDFDIKEDNVENCIGREVLLDVGNTYNEQKSIIDYNDTYVYPYPDTEKELNFKLYDSSAFKPDDLRVDKFALSFPIQDVNIIPFEPSIPEQRGEDENGNEIVVAGEVPRKPQQVQVALTMKLTLTTTLKNKTVMSVATYELTDGLIEDDGVENAETTYFSKIVEKGKWSMVSYEKMDR